MESSVKKTAQILKDAINIILALAFTNSIIVFISNPNTPGAPIQLMSLQTNEILIFLALIFAIIRFFHGNMAYLNITYNILKIV